ncbi:MAG: hypothetical protein OXI79_20380 [Gammaproteobacteria bacterium]|nr:hypothetical protein [Gammaproteobacteria bacterium]
MAGENIRLLSPRGMVTIEHTLEADIARGDQLRVGAHSQAFALSAGKKGETVAMCIRAQLVDYPVVTKVAGINAADRRPVAGDLIEVENGKTREKKIAADGQTVRPREYVGVVHRTPAADATRMELVWMGPT